MDHLLSKFAVVSHGIWQTGLQNLENNCHGKQWSFVIRGSMMMTTNNIGEMTGRSMTAKMTPFYVTVTTVAVIDMVCGRHCCRRHCLPCGRHCLPCGRHLVAVIVYPVAVTVYPVAVIVYPVAVILWPSLSTLWPSSCGRHCLPCGLIVYSVAVIDMVCGRHFYGRHCLWPSLYRAVISDRGDSAVDRPV